jgi:hypothetical protein
MNGVNIEQLFGAINAISFWDSDPPGYRWNEIAVNLLVRNNITGPRSARLLSLLNVAIYDATIASDIEAGLEIGRAVAQKVIEQAKNDGSQ